MGTLAYTFVLSSDRHCRCKSDGEIEDFEDGIGDISSVWMRRKGTTR